MKKEPKDNLKQVMEDLVSKDGLIRYFKQIKKILKRFMDMEEKDYSLVSLWIMGTYLHKQFSSYPYLFFNAMKGSGKSRVLKIVASLSYNGEVLGSMTEAVLFRTAQDSTICIDEFENISVKGNESLKTLLNAGYKRGTKVKRMKKTQTKEGEAQEVEEFEVYTPITMANIRGMDNVLEDRCITIILEKSNKYGITKLIENFENDIEFQKVRGGLKRITANIKPEDNVFGNLIDDWNEYIESKYDDKIDKSVTKSQKIDKPVTKSQREMTLVTLVTVKGVLYNKINKINISGRDLELFFPLFIIADMCSGKLFGEILETSKKMINEKKEKDRDENKDVQLYEFISNYDDSDFYTATKIVNDFRIYCEVGEKADKWLNSTWIGKALTRLKLIKERQRSGKSRKMRLNVEKAKEKLLMFKEINEDSVTSVSSVSSVIPVTSVTNNNKEEDKIEVEKIK